MVQQSFEQLHFTRNSMAWWNCCIGCWKLPSYARWRSSKKRPYYVCCSASGLSWKKTSMQQLRKWPGLHSDLKVHSFFCDHPQIQFLNHLWITWERPCGSFNQCLLPTTDVKHHSSTRSRIAALMPLSGVMHAGSHSNLLTTWNLNPIPFS